jgi:membrane-associated phospholipid phosphatase
MTITATHPTHDQRSLLEPDPGAVVVDGEQSLHPVRSALVVMAIGYVALTAVMIAIGTVLVHVLDGSVGRWDLHVNRWFVVRRSTGWNDVTGGVTAAVNTMPVIGTAAVIVGFLWWRHRVREAAFLALALTLEVTVFLTTAFVVARPRPAVPHLDSAPPTSSFPSGHTAAATVLFVGLAFIIMCCTTAVAVRVLSAVIAASFATAVGLGRVYRGLHSPSDVFAGALLGLSCLVVAAIAVRIASVQAEARARRHADAIGDRADAARPPAGARETVAI